jgi:hypothetical protein
MGQKYHSPFTISYDGTARNYGFANFSAGDGETKMLRKIPCLESERDADMLLIKYDPQNHPEDIG